MRAAGQSKHRMNTMQRISRSPLRFPRPGRWQHGGLTIFTGIFVLILMTLMLLYATRVGVFEQRTSGNEARQKIAFHIAESATDQGLEFFQHNTLRVFSSDLDAAPDGAGNWRPGFFRNLFFNDGSEGWALCTDANEDSDDHPCGGEMSVDVIYGTCIDRTDKSTCTPNPNGQRPYFWDDPTTTSGNDSLPIVAGALPANSAARVTALLCLVDPDNLANGCQPPPSTYEEKLEARAIVQLMGYGFTDCTDVTDLSTCPAEARVARPLSNYNDLTGTPTVPLTTKSTFPPTGTAEVVPNPNAGGEGVPVSVWSNNNVNCADPPAVTGQGSWATCEMHEWYGRDSRPDDVLCDSTPCSCTVDESISYTAAQTTYQGIDIIEDDAFPCDLFDFYFGVPRAEYEIIKGAATVISDCNNLGPYDSGLFWVSGSTCHIAANTQVGSPDAPVIIISAATSTKLNGGAKIFGVLYVFDGEDANATLDSAGTNTVYGAVIVDATMGNYNGTFQIVYSDGVLASAKGLGGVGDVSGGWRDFGLPAWQ